MNVSILCLVLVGVITRNQEVPVTQGGSVTTSRQPDVRVSVEKNTTSSFWQRRGMSPVYIVTPTRPQYTVCVNSSCFLTRNSKLVPFYKSVFHYSSRVRHSWDLENHSLTMSRVRVRTYQITPYFPTYVFCRKELWMIHDLWQDRSPLCCPLYRMLVERWM